ncbi:MAG: hypothetical protein ABH832_02740 [bacterium]
MRKIIALWAIAIMLGMYILPAMAATEGEVKKEWFDARANRVSADSSYRQARVVYAMDRSVENDRKVVDAAKKTLLAVLDEAEAWLKWKNIEAKNNPEVPDSLKASIEQDVNSNLSKIMDLRKDVNNIKNRIDVGVVFINMIGSYTQLLTDVARNTGLVWVHLGQKRIDTSKNYEAKLRSAALKLSDNDEIIKKLDTAVEDIFLAQEKVNSSKKSYEAVNLPGMPFIKFAEGNNYLRGAKIDLINAQARMVESFNLIIKIN